MAKLPSPAPEPALEPEVVPEGPTPEELRQKELDSQKALWDEQVRHSEAYEKAIKEQNGGQ